MRYYLAFILVTRSARLLASNTSISRIYTHANRLPTTNKDDIILDLTLLFSLQELYQQMTDGVRHIECTSSWPPHHTALLRKQIMSMSDPNTPTEVRRWSRPVLFILLHV
ncbi:hypothetical protein BDR03DRAFT_387742 [Suillus americanus]|nr:hypothetical protein BDR03DRAFT_387742 [Suillus americanus]